MFQTSEDLYRELDKVYATGQFKKVEEFLLRAAAENTACCGNVNPLQISAYNELGALYRGAGLQDKAVGAFRRAGELTAQAEGKNSFPYATVLNNLAGAYRLKGDLDQALECFDTARALYEKTVGRDTYYYASVLNNMSLLFLDRGEPARARETVQAALEIVKDRPDLRQEKAVALTNLASAELAQGQPEEAEDCLQKAVALYAALPPAQRTHLAAAHNTLGGIRMGGRDYIGAAEEFSKAKELTGTYFGKNGEYAAACCNLARALRAGGRGDEAGDEYRKGIDLYETLGMGASPACAAARRELESPEAEA